METRAWLEANGFASYAELFEASEIDAAALLALTEAHLKELGLPLGPRIKLAAALARLKAESPAPQAPVSDAPLGAAPHPDAPATAERRQLSVMFVDLVGSLSMSSRLDPEDLRSLIRDHQQTVATEVQRLGGHVAQYLGDGLMAYFGYPIAHEGEAERAVRAAVAILPAVAALHRAGWPALGVRIGVASGLVVVGDLLGQGSARERAVVGETPNLAARLQSLAAPGEILISAQTADLVTHAYELTNLGPQALKGLPAPVPVYRVGRERAQGRLESRTGEQLGAMIGREHELAMLLERWQSAKAGEAQLVVLTGDAGIGKSRIVRALQDALQPEPHARVRLQCSPYHADTPLYPSIQYLKLVAGIQADDGADTQRDKLGALLRAFDARALDDAHVLALMLGIPGADGPGPARLPPPQVRQRTFDALTQQLRLLTEARPVLLVCEDAHWMDPTTLELMGHYADGLSACRLMILITARTGFQHHFGDVCDASSIVLNRLGRAQIAALASRVAGGKALPEALIREIATRTDGVPLFAEELTKSLLESGALRETQHAYEVATGSREVAVPASLHDSLMARLDRLPSAKEVAQTAACIGRDFEAELLAEVLAQDRSAVDRALQQLVQAELVQVRGQPPQLHYAFKHALVRDTAYSSLLRTTRQQIHTRLATALARTPDSTPELLAHHALQAGLVGQAIAAYEKAAAQAMARPAYKEAIAHLQHAVDLTAQLGDASQARQKRLQLLVTLGQALIPLRGYGHPQTVEAFVQAQDVAAQLGATPHRFAIAYAVWVSRYIRAEHDQALATARDMLAWARADGNVGHTVSGLRCQAISQMITGQPGESVLAFEEAARLAGPYAQLSLEQRTALAQRFAADPAIATQFHHGFALWALGRLAEAAERVATALAEARAMGHAHTLAHALAHAAILAVLNRDAAAAQRLGAETVAFAEKHELAMWKGYGAVLQAYGLALAGETAAAAALMDTGLRGIEATRTGAMVVLHHAMQACTLARLGRHDEAQVHAEVVGRELRAGSERYYWPECQRLLGDYLQLCPGEPPQAVEAAHQQALRWAQDQGARSWGLYAALSLARHLVEAGRPEQARAVLTPVLAEWPDAGRLPAHREAQALLQALSPPAAPEGLADFATASLTVTADENATAIESKP